MPVLKGTRVQADSIVENYETGSPVDEIAYNFDLKPEDIRAVLAYAARQRARLEVTSIFDRDAERSSTAGCPIQARLVEWDTPTDESFLGLRSDAEEFSLSPPAALACMYFSTGA